MGPVPHQTPLRRISQGSLFALSRSAAPSDAPHGLGFLEPAMSELLDEAEALHANLDALRHLGDALGTFNESFASWLYVMDMNALTVDWPQAPTDASFLLARRRAEEDVKVALAALQAQGSARNRERPLSGDKTTMPDATDTEITYAGTTTTAAGAATDVSAGSSKPAPSGPKIKKKVKPKMTAKEKKERSIAVEETVSCLPLEFRGKDPNLRRNIETIIEAMMDSAGRGVKLIELIAPPDLNQARVNKCLIALVNRKIVQKDNSTGAVLYHWLGVPG